MLCRTGDHVPVTVPVNSFASLADGAKGQRWQRKREHSRTVAEPSEHAPLPPECLIRCCGCWSPGLQ